MSKSSSNMEGYKYSVLACGLYQVTVGRKRLKLVVKAHKNILSATCIGPLENSINLI